MLILFLVEEEHVAAVRVAVELIAQASLLAPRLLDERAAEPQEGAAAPLAYGDACRYGHGRVAIRRRASPPGAVGGGGGRQERQHGGCAQYRKQGVSHILFCLSG